MKLFVIYIFTTLLPIAYSQLLNDDCVDAIIIPPDVAALPYTNIIPNFVNATANPADPNSSCQFSSPEDKPETVWYYWEPSSTTLVDFSSIGVIQSRNIFSDFYPVITIYEGEDCNELSELACTEFLFLAAFQATAGKKYFIAISDYANGDSITVTFSVTNTPPIPPSDECVEALVIPSTITFPFSTPPVQVSSATENINDPVSSCTESTEFPTSAPFVFPTSAPFVFPTSAPFVFPTSAPFVFPTATPLAFVPATIETVWFTWIPQVTGLYDFRTDKTTAAFGRSGIPTAIEVYVGNSCNSVTEVACSRVGQRISGAKLDAGLKYFIKVVTELGDFGTSLILTVNQTPTTPPENDECINAVVVNPFDGDIIIGDTFYATPEDMNITASCGGYESPGLWYKFSVPKATLIDVSTCNTGTTYDSTISILSGDNCGALTCIASDDDGDAQGCGLSSYVSFLATASTTYYILVQGYNRNIGEFAMTVVGSLNYFALIDSKTDEIIQPIENYAFFSYNSLPSSTLNIQASFNDTVKSALLTFDNPPRSFCERSSPFAVFGNSNSDYLDGNIPVGPHIVTATPYNRVNCKGPAGTKISRSFEVSECNIAYYYYDFTSISTEPTYFYFDDAIPACNINIEVSVECGFDIGFVELKIRSKATNRIVQTKMELDAPYFVFGNRGEVINKGSLKPGNYTIELNIDGIQHASTPFTAFDNGSCK